MNQRDTYDWETTDSADWMRRIPDSVSIGGRPIKTVKGLLALGRRIYPGDDDSSVLLSMKDSPAYDGLPQDVKDEVDKLLGGIVVEDSLP